MGVASGQWINLAKLSSDSEIPKETLRRFVQLLEDTLLAVRLPPFRPSRSTSRRLLQRQRVLLFDVGVRNALLGLHRHRLSADQLGAVFEQWTILQVIYLSRAGATGWKLSSYRSEAGAEVDLVIDRGEDVVGLEIKSGRNVGAVDTRGLLSLESLLTPKQKLRKWIAYRGERRQRFDNGVEVWPVLEVLGQLAADAGVT
jgi:hypothetical protein